MDTRLVFHRLKVNGLEKALTGLEIGQGWTIEGPRPLSATATGGCHSLGFKARHKDGGRAFVKVLDPTPDPLLPADEQLKDLQHRLAVFNYETDLLNKCLSRRIRRVVRILGRDSIKLSGYPIDIHYLMFELADSDLREHATLVGTVDVALNMNILHQVALGLEALHFNQIAHQDLKPSNVLLFNELVAKIGDLGHAHDKSVPRPGTSTTIGGDPGHAAPEQLYGYKLNEWQERYLSSDLYLLGSLAVFMFTNVSLTAQIASCLRPEHHWLAWPGAYRDVLPYVRDAWNASMNDFGNAVDKNVREELVTLTRHLTDPEPENRGHPRNRTYGGPRFGVRRFSSRFQVLVRTAEHSLASRQKV